VSAKEKIAACYACGNEIPITESERPYQITALAREGIYHALCEECVEKLDTVRSFRFIHRCVIEAVTPRPHKFLEHLERGPSMLPVVEGGKRPDDPWKHRSAGMRCSTCMWYVPKVSAPREVLGQTAHIVEETPIGRCRRHAPAMGGYPVVKRDDWCGDHRIDENKA
jgi:hypothetical protein